MQRGSTHTGDYHYLTCTSPYYDSIGDARQYSDSNGYMVFERCTAANLVKGQGTWVVDEKETKLTCVSKTVNYTAQPNELINCDISAGGFIITLPTAPADKTRIHVKLNTIGLNQQLTLKTGGTDKFNEPTGTTEIYMYLFGSYAQMQYCATSGLWTTFISAGTFNFATQFPGIDAVTPITENDVTFDATTGVLTIVPPLGYFNFYVNGNGIITRYRKVGTVTFPAITDTSGQWYFYFNNAGEPISTQVAWNGADFHTIATVYRVLWNSTLVGTAKAVSEYIEWHLNTISADDHIWKHAQGSIWLNGLDIFDNFLTSGTPNIDGRNTCVSLSTGVVTDENLPYRVVNDSTPTTFWEQDLGNNTPASLNSTNSGLFKIFVQDSAGRASFLPATRFPFAWDVTTNRPQFITTTGVRTLVADNRWFVYFLYAVQNPKTGEAIKLVSSAAEYTSLANAQAVTWTNIQALYPTLFNDTEIRPLYKLIFYNNHLGAFPVGAKYTALRERQDIRKAAVTSTTTASGSIAASSVTLVPVGNVASTNVQSAIQELDSEKLSLDQSTPQTQTHPQIITSLVKGKLTYTDSNGQMKEIDAVYDPVKLQIQIGDITGYSNAYGLAVKKRIITDGQIEVGAGNMIISYLNLATTTNAAFTIKNVNTGANSAIEIWTKNIKAATFTPTQGLDVVGAISASNLSGTNTGDNAVNSLYSGLAASKQDTLASGTNIKTINGDSILGSGNLVVTGAGEVNTASNLGTGEGVYSTKVGSDLRFKSLKAGTNVTLSSDANEITINASGGGGGTSLWTAIAGTRASNTSFTVGSDITTYATKGLIFKWTESNVLRCAMTTSSSFSSPNTTVNIVGDTMASIDSGSLKYTFMPHQKYEWKLAGTIGATGTNVAQIHYVREPMRVIGAEISTNVAGTTNSTSVNIINSNGTVTVVSPSLATTVANNTTVTAPATSGLSLAINDKLTENIVSTQTTPCVDLYVDLLVFPTRFLNLN